MSNVEIKKAVREALADIYTEDLSRVFAQKSDEHMQYQSNMLLLMMLNKLATIESKIDDINLSVKDVKENQEGLTQMTTERFDTVLREIRELKK